MNADLKIEQVTNSGKWWQYVLQINEIKFPDGRAVYKYKLSDELVSKAESILKYNKNILENDNLEKFKPLCGLLICWAAEIFKRNVDVASPEWKDIFKYLQIDPSVNQREKMVKFGLDYLGIKVKEISGRREWLVTIQLLGGFPLNLFINEKESWLKDYFSKILAEAFRYNEKITHEISSEIVRKKDFSFNKKSYDDDIFYDLAADFICELQNLKIEYAPNLQRGESLVGKFEQFIPSWQANLPIAIPESKKIAIDKILKEEIDKASRRPKNLISKIIRGLKRDGENFESFLSFEIADEMEFSAEKAPSCELKLWAIGESAILISKPIAMAEMPWGVETKKREKVILEISQKVKRAIKFPLQQNLALEWQGEDGFKLSIKNNEYKGMIGQAGDVLCFKLPHENLDFYEYIGAGSVDVRDKEIIVLVKDDNIKAKIEETFFERIGYASINDAQYQVFKISGQVNIEIDDSKYQIKTGVEPKTNDIIAQNIYSTMWRAKDRSANLFCGELRLIENEKTRQAQRGELFWRKNRNEDWMDYFIQKPTFGKFRVKWLDKNDNYIKSTKTIILLPEKISINGEVIEQFVNINIENAADFNIKISDDNVSSNSANNGRLKNGLKTKIDCEILHYDYILPIEVICKLKHNCFVDIEGKKLNNRLRIDKLIGASAVSKNNKGNLNLRIKSEGDANNIEIGYEMPNAEIGENSRLPLSHLEDLIWELIAIETNQDISIIIEFDDYTKLEIYQYDKQLTKAEDKGVILLGNELENQSLVFRSCLEPWIEIEPLETKGQTHFGHKIILPPNGIKGAAMAYTRAGDYVTTRPFWAGGDDIEAPSVFEQICQIPKPDIRQHQLRAWFHNPDNLNDAVDIIIKTAKSLNGFPLTCLDIFKIEPPEEVLVTALLQATDEDFDIIYNLQKELPFSWYLIKQKNWKEVFNKIQREIFQALSVSYKDNGIALNLTKKQAKARLDLIVNRDGLFKDLFHINFPEIYSDITEVISKDYEECLAELQGKCKDISSDTNSPKFMDFNDKIIRGKFNKRFDGLLDPENEMYQWFISPFIAAQAILGERDSLSAQDRLGIWLGRNKLDDYSYRADWENGEPPKRGHAFNDALIAIIKNNLKN